MSFVAHSVSYPTSDTQTPLVCIQDSYDGSLHMFGRFGEGFQRRCNQIGLKLVKAENLFLTGTMNWESVSGLPGFILTASDSGNKKFSLFHSGNKLLNYIIATWRGFIFRFGLELNVQELDNGVTHALSSGKSLKIVNIPSADKSLGENIITEEGFSLLQNITKSIFPIETESSRVKKIAQVELPTEISNPQVSANVIFQVAPTRGKFMPKEAIKLGVKFTQFKDLCNFNSVTLEDGTIIQPEQVLEPSKNFKPILFIDIPSADHLENTMNYNWIEEVELPYGMVYHFIDSSVPNPLINPKYIEFINSFDEKTIHVISYKPYTPNPINFVKSFQNSLKWRSILPRMFPMIRFSDTPELEIPNELKHKVFAMGPNQRFTIQAGKDVEETRNYKQSPTSTEIANTTYEEVLEHINNKPTPREEFFNQEYDLPKSQADFEKPLIDQVEVKVFGTGSALPALARNVLSNSVRIPYMNANGDIKYKSIILDAGEDTMGAIDRMLNESKKREFYQELKMIYLSHLHADHHLGIFGIINQWNHYQDELPKEERSKLYIVSPLLYHNFVKEIHKIDYLSNYDNIEYFNCGEFLITNDGTNEQDTGLIERRNAFYQDLQIEDFKNVYANHCEFAYMVAITFQLYSNNLPDVLDKQQMTFKVSFSGDSRPVKKFQQISYLSDLFIHEATLEDEKFEDAIFKKHSTFSEAVHMAMVSNARRLLLTHFSQRYIGVEYNRIYDRLNGKFHNELIENTTDNNNNKKNDETDSIYSGSESDDEPINMATSTTTTFTAAEKNSNTLSSELPIELKAPIFKYKLTPGKLFNANRMNVVLAFDNMNFLLGEMHLQKKAILENEDAIKVFFPDEEDKGGELDIESLKVDDKADGEEVERKRGPQKEKKRDKKQKVGV